jgi:predicted nucleotidyltransferase
MLLVKPAPTALLKIVQDLSLIGLKVDLVMKQGLKPRIRLPILSEVVYL